MKYLLVCLLCCSFHSAYTQQFAFESGCNNDEGIYNNYYNRVKLVVEGLSCSDVILKSDSFDVRKTDDCIFYIRATRKQHTIAPIEIFDKRSNKLIQRVYMEFTDSIPLPELKVNRPGGREYGYVISLSTDSIYCVAPFSDRYNQAMRFSVLSYEIEVISRDKTIYSQKVTGCKISKETKKQMEKMYAEDYFVLRKIKVKDENGNEYLIPKKILPVSP